MSERLEKNTAQGIRTNESDLDVGLEHDHQGVTHSAVPVQYKAGSSSGQELQQEKEQHSGTAEEKYVMASATASSSSGGDDDSKNEGNPLQGKFTSGGAGNRLVTQYKYQISGSYPAVPIQRIAEEEEPLQGKMGSAIQRMAEEEEPLQGKMSGTIQRMAEEEEPLQGKMNGTVQRMAEEEEPLQGKMSEAIQRMSEEEEPLQGKMSGAIQRMAEEEEPMQGKMSGAIQRMAEEEEPMQGKMIGAIQRMAEEEEPLQGKMVRPIQKKSSSAQTTQRQSATSAKLPNLVQSKMEGAMGADFSGVEIHTESQNATNVGALAYAQGNDVHFAPGQYDPQSTSGQELIGHELAHVVQQREGRVQPTTQAKGLPVNDDKGLEAEADEMGRKAAQLKVDEHTQSLLLGASNQATRPSDPIQRNVNAPIQMAKVGLLKPAAVHSFDAKSGKVIHKVLKKLKRGHLVQVDPTTLKKDAKGQDYYAAEGGYIKTIYLGVGGLSNIPGSSVSVTGVADDIDDNEDSLAENAANGIDGTSEAFDGVTAMEGVSESTEKGMGFASSGASMGSGLVGIGLAINQIVTGEDGWEKLDGALSLGGSIAQTTEGVLDTVSNASEKGSAVAENTEMAGSAFGSLGDALNFGKETINAIKTIYDAYQDAKSMEGSSSAEKFEAAMEAISSAVEASASAVSAVDGILNMLGQGVAALGQYALPGLTIVISGLDIAIRTYKMVKANVSRNKMKKRKEEIAKKYGKMKKTRFGETVSIPELTSRQKALQSLANPSAAESEEMVELEEALFVAEMEKINQKRMVRAGINIGIDLVKIGGDIAALTGVGAVATMPMKAFAAGADVSISVFRKLKQMGRDKASEAVKTDPNSRWGKVFNSAKSTTNKKAQRRSDADYILKQIAAMEKDTSKPKYLLDTERIEDYIRAAGGHPQAMYRKFGAEGIGGVKGYLVEIMAKRD